MSTNNKRSSKPVASDAGSILASANASEIQKSLAASVLSQRASGKETGEDMEAKASAVLKSPKYADETKELAASLLSQSNRDR